MQARVFKAMGICDEEARAKFGFLLDALKMGAPPHGGIALGMDRLVDAPHRRRVAARRGGLAQDAEGHRSHDRRARATSTRRQLRDVYVKSTYEPK